MKHTVNDGFPYYIELVGRRNYQELFESTDNFKLLGKITEEQSKFRYAPGKWSIRQIVGHMTDHERIMTYRILRFSRKDSTPLAGYDQDVLMAGARFDKLPYRQIVDDFKLVRKTSLSMMAQLSASQLQLKGKAWVFELTVKDFLKATIGHELHHINIIRERYLT